MSVLYERKYNMIMSDTIFREYDIRGKVGTELLIDEVYNLTCAITYYFKEQNPKLKVVAVGMDGRTHSPIIKEKMVQALADSGLDVVFLGLCTSPALYFALHTISVDAGLMITASHNGKEYNGIKICLGTQSVWGKEIQVIQQLYKAGRRLLVSNKGAVTDYSIVPLYVDWLINHFSHLKNKAISAVIDCGNGAGGAVMPQLIQKMGWSGIELLCGTVDGTYPNHEADPTVEENMLDVKERLLHTFVSVGIGLDGDADRMGAMTKSGFLVPGDQLLALFAQQILDKNPGAHIVYDIKSSSGLSELIAQWGGVGVMSPSGHSIIKEHMELHHAPLGGELSCHFSFKDRYFGYDDGIYALLRLLELLDSSGQLLDNLLRVFPKKYSSREFRIFCPEDEKFTVVDMIKQEFEKLSDVSLITIDGVRASMAYGWGIVRASNTQPALSIRFEGYSVEGLERVKNDFIAVLQPYMPTVNLFQVFNL